MDLEKIKQKIRPDEKAILKEAGVFLARVNELVKKNKINATAIIGGSLAKGTFLKGDHDVDIFVKFSKEYENEKLSDILEKILKPLKAERVHGSRDYFVKHHNGMKYEIVPVYDVKSREEIVNITDASPLHFVWLKKQALKNQSLIEDIRLAKAFCKSIGAYGAESYIRGFSGHVLDILVAHYGSFMSLARNAAKWEKPVVIDFNNVYNGQAMERLNKAKIESPLVLIDPIQPDRNAAAALSREMFDKFIKSAKAFLKKPSEGFFERKEFSLSKIKNKNTIILEVKPLEGKKDVVGSKLLKALETIKMELEKNGFSVKSHGWHWNEKAYFWFSLKSMRIPKTFVHKGPPLKDQKNADNFRQKYKRTFVKGKRIYAKVERKVTDAKKLVNEILRNEIVKRNFRKAEVLQ